MKIISKRPDYYDSIAYMYGGGDPKIYYERDKYNTNVVVIPSGMRQPFKSIRGYATSTFEFKNLVVGDRMFVIYRKQQVPGESIEPWKLLLDPTELLKHSPSYYKNEIKKFVETCQFQQFPEDMLFITRRIGNPVYIIKYVEWVHGKYYVHVEDTYTPLYTYGLQNIYPPEQVYQDLSYFLANRMKDSPDLQPAGKPPQTDKEKIVAHGMDLKTSFRHRK